MVEFTTDFFVPPRPRAMAHRGASASYPENTIAAFDAAVRVGVPYIELDLHMTRDGELVVIHDGNLRRTCGISAAVKELTLSQILEADAGYNFSPDGVSLPFRGKGVRIPRLDEVLTTFERTFFVLEIKQDTPSLTRQLLETIRRARALRRVMIACEHQQPLAEVRSLEPGLPASFSGFEVAQFFGFLEESSRNYEPPGAAIQIPPVLGEKRLLTPRAIEAAHRIGVEVHAWTINEESEMRELLASGVDGIITDYPSRLLGLLQN
jgi:glycerophosphoryl diester phosphodiesterase